MLAMNSVMNLSTFEIERLIASAQLGDSVGGLNESEARQFQAMAKSFGRKTRLAAQSQTAGTYEVVFVETPNEILRRIQKLPPLG